MTQRTFQFLVGLFGFCTVGTLVCLSVSIFARAYSGWWFIGGILSLWGVWAVSYRLYMREKIYEPVDQTSSGDDSHRTMAPRGPVDEETPTLSGTVSSGLTGLSFESLKVSVSGAIDRTFTPPSAPETGENQIDLDKSIAEIKLLTEEAARAKKYFMDAGMDFDSQSWETYKEYQRWRRSMRFTKDSPETFLKWYNGIRQSDQHPE